MPRVHRLTGYLTVVAFVLTGVYMRVRYPGWQGVDNAVRFLHRTNHVYILMSGLVNLAVGTYLRDEPRRRTRQIGSCMLLAAPVVLLAAFIIEPNQARPQRPTTEAGVIMLAAGTLCHALRRRERT